MTGQQHPPVSDEIPLDEFFDLVSAPRRRAVLAELASREHPLSVNDLTKALVERERDEPITELPDDAVTRTYLSLYHVHVPALVETPLVEYDAERELVEPTAAFDRVRSVLSTVDEADTVDDLAGN